MTRVNEPVAPQVGKQTALLLPLECAADAATCGAKAVNLGRMLRAGLPVPPGFVLTARSLDAFIALGALRSALDRVEQHLTAAQRSARLEAETEVEALFAATPLPASIADALLYARLHLQSPLAVRSSAAAEDGAGASYAGLLCSTLNVAGEAALEQALKRTWASRWSARAASYGRARGPALGAIAVIIQTQVHAHYAGVLFTRSPISGRDDEMLCEYCPGTAERLVAGEITPEQISIARDRCVIGDRAAQATDAVAPAWLERLANIAMTAERLFGAPQDLEWALDRSQRPWLVQARPITARAPRVQRIVWSNANVNENFPAPISPLLYSVASPGYAHYFLGLGRAFGLSRKRLAGMAPDLRLVIGAHSGRMYYNLTAIHSILRQAPGGERLVAWFDDFTGVSAGAHAADDGAVSAEAGDHRGTDRSTPDARSIDRRSAFGLTLELAWIALNTTWQYLFIERRVAAFERSIDAFAARTAPERLNAKSLLGLRDDLRAFLDIRLNRWTNAALADAAAMVCYGLLKATVGRSFPAGAAAHLHNSLLKGITGLKSAEPVAALWALAREVRADAALRALFRDHCGAAIAERLAADPEFASFNARFQDYLERWGFRCSGELMLTVASFQERPAELLEIVRAYASQDVPDPNAQLEAQRASREAITADALAHASSVRVARWLAWPNAATMIDVLMRMTRAAIGLRERARYKQALLYSRLRRIALEIGARLGERGIFAAPEDVFFLSIGELDELLSGAAMYPSATQALVRLRREAHEEFERRSADDILFTAPGEYAAAGCAQRKTSGGDRVTALRGMSVCGGVARGQARVLVHVGESGSLCRGDILVTRQTDPGWAPVFGAIGGLVLERGGMLSHGAILAREYGIPTVVGIADAAERIKTGTPIEVDGDRGELRLLA